MWPDEGVKLLVIKARGARGLRWAGYGSHEGGQSTKGCWRERRSHQQQGCSALPIMGGRHLFFPWGNPMDWLVAQWGWVQRSGETPLG